MSQTVLIVDDGPDWRSMLAGLFKDIFPELKVLVAGSVEQAETLLNSQPCDLAIIDIRLDESDEQNIDGLRLLAKIRANHPATSAIIITGYASLDTVEHALQPNPEGVRMAIDYVEKSKVNTDLLPRVKEILNKTAQG